MKHYIIATLILVLGISVMTIAAKVIGTDTHEAVVNGLLCYVAFKILVRDIKEDEE